MSGKSFGAKTGIPKNALKLEEAEYLIKTNKTNEALVILEDLNYSSKEEYVNYQIASIYFGYDNMNKAKEYIELSLNSDVLFIPALKLKRAISLIEEEFDIALDINTRLLNLDAFNSENLLLQADILLKSGSSSEAEKLINNYLEIFPNDEQANHLKTQILSGREDYRQALINLNLLVEQNPSKIEYFIERADIYYKLESWQFAANDYSMALDIDPKLENVWYRYGMCHHYLDFNKKACRAWQKAANLKSRDAAKMLYQYCQ